ncbi:MAG: type II toxin-antitoxin system death-on-curing family toxin [Hyphomicrobiales bacterium]|nr:type II toxin-antitoxin system death-on-curing family toxin [Hyphomicrobiales bacterium]MBV8827354.1 type II toxin-antitoxin system death-on-curing family toxin [Hyphomicrobiales bacterium]
MRQLRWLSLEEVLVIHERQLGRFGGAAGIRDQGMLESALSRPRNKWEYEHADIVELAAAYAFGIARNHPFVDGNKRVAFLAMAAFLRLNGVHFAPSQEAATAAILALAAGEIDETGLTRWLVDNIAASRAWR